MDLLTTEHTTDAGTTFPGPPGTGTDDPGTAPPGATPHGAAPPDIGPDAPSIDPDTDPSPGGLGAGPGFPGGWSALAGDSPDDTFAPPPGPPPPGAPPEGPPPPAGGWNAPPPPPAAGHPRRSLRRDVHRRVLGGVAAGLADYLEIDVAIVRIAFVVLAVLFGSGVLLYAAAWLLIPAQDSGRAVIHDLVEARPRRRSLIALVLGAVIAVVAVSNLFSSGPWWRHWDGGGGGFGFFLGLVALVLAGALLVVSGRREGSPVRWVLLTASITMLAVVVVIVATVFSVEAISGVPLRGGIGDVQWQPTSAAQVAPKYRLAIGNMRLDLRDVPFRAGTTHVTASVGIGHVIVELPPGPAVSVTAHAGMGDVQMFGQNEGGLSTGRTMRQLGAAPGDNARIVLDAQVGVGQVQVTRGLP